MNQICNLTRVCFLTSVLLVGCSSLDEKPEPVGNQQEVAPSSVEPLTDRAETPPADFIEEQEIAALAEPTELSQAGEPLHCPCPADDIFGEASTPEKNSLDWFIEKRHQISKGVHDLGLKLDDMLDGEGVVEPEENKTYLKIKLSDTQEEGGKNYADHSLKFKLDLPNTEERLKVVFDSDPEDSDSISQRNVIQQSNSTTLDKQKESSTGALRIVFDEVNLWRFSWDNGVRFNFPLEVFTRVTAKRSVQITDLWTARFSQKVFWFKEDGYGETSELWFERPITETYFLSLKTEMQWLDENRYFEYSQVLSTFHNISGSEVMEYNVGVLGESKPNPRVTLPYINITYRKRIYEDWLFWHLTPQVTFPRESNWNDYWSLTIGAEIIFKR